MILWYPLNCLKPKEKNLLRELTKLVYHKDGVTILVGDGVKASKEVRKMPGVKKLHQESQNSSKGEYIFGHMFGGIGVIVGNNLKLFSIPLFTNIQVA